jgi:CheY-like chemotaxis protein
MLMNQIAFRAPPPLDGRATILVVDDEEDVRSMCRRALESDGATVLEADDGVTALSLLQERAGNLDLIITDLTMPRLGGEALAEVVSIFFPDLPVLAISGDPGVIDRRLPTLLKPFPIETLIEAAQLMRSRSAEMRVVAQEQRARAREAREFAAAMQARNNGVRHKLDLVAVALELQRLNGSRNRSADPAV